MYLPQPSQGGDFTPPPAGTHPAVCYRFIDLGDQQTSFDGKPKTAHKIMLSWEITDPELRMEDGKPFIISNRYTWSMHEKANLRKSLESWRGRPFLETDFGDGGFDVKTLLGVGCLLNIIHVEKDNSTYANISAIMKMPKSMDAGICVNSHAFLALTTEGFDREVFNGLSDKLQETIKSSPQYQALERPDNQDGYVPPNFEDPAAGANSADIPF